MIVNKKSEIRNLLLQINFENLNAKVDS